MIRPEIRAAARRHREGIVALLLAALFVRVAMLGGVILVPLGLAGAALCAAYGLAAWRRARFVQPVSAPGLVEVDEGRILYFGAANGLGGVVALEDLREIRLLRLSGGAHLRLVPQAGAALVVPVAAEGAGALYDAFARLPGFDSAALLAALEDPRGPAFAHLWSAAGAGGGALPDGAARAGRAGPPSRP